jgi:sec-independent protein translocase protein TatA
MLGLDNPIHLVFLLLLLLIVFGAKRLPEMGRSLGTGLRGFKESLSGEADPSSLTPGEYEPLVETAVAPAPVQATVASTANDSDAPRA